MPGIFSKLWDAMCIKQWNIAVARMSFNEILKKGSLDGGDFHWLPMKAKARLHADPFIHHTDDGRLQVIYESLCYYKGYGKLSVATLDEQFNVVSDKDFLDTGFHLSYPFIIHDNGKLFLVPENSQQGDVYIYHFDPSREKLIEKEILKKSWPLLDATITYHDDRFWMFATLRGKNSNDELHIFHAPHWSGPYQAHAGNPVKKTLAGTRPAGSIIRHEGFLYRPAQNCAEYYGKSVIINKIKKLTENSFEEEPVIELNPPKGTKFNFGIHTINFSNDVIVIDGLRRIFAPFDQFSIFWNKRKRRLEDRTKTKLQPWDVTIPHLKKEEIV